MKYQTSTYGNLNPLTIVCIPHTHGISNGLLSYIVSQVKLLWNIDHLPWYIKPSTHDISNTLLSLGYPLEGAKYHGVQFTKHIIFQ